MKGELLIATIDPKATPWESPYVSMGNNPILFNDVFGDSIGVGKSITDKLITFRQFGANVSANYRGIDVRRIFNIPPYPILNYKHKFKGFPISSKDYVVGFSGGGLHIRFMTRTTLF